MRSKVNTPGYLAFLLLLASCGGAAGTTTSPIPPQPTLTPTRVPLSITLQPAPPLPDWIQVYFTDPSAPSASTFKGGPDKALAEAIDNAATSVDMAVYTLGLDSVRDALLSAYHRGVTVRLVMETKNMGSQQAQDLKNAGVPLVEDPEGRLMHDKFVIIDRSEVWTGSANYNTGGIYKNENDLICIQSQDVAAAYTAEFEQMFTSQLFGPDKPARSSTPTFSVDGTPVEVYFSPEDGIASKIIGLMDSAAESIYFMAYSFTSRDMAAELITRSKAGITVAGVMNNGQVPAGQVSQYGVLRAAGLNVYRNTTNDMLRYRAIIIDQKIVITGSYDFDASADTLNDENMVAIINASVAAKYLEEFQKIYQQAQP